ncbi:MAG: phosphate-starvation-inducible PsiE family protein [Chloroflexota bacterium]
MSHSSGEPSLRPQPTRTEGRLTEVLERVESLLTSVVAVLLVAFVGIALLAVLAEVRGPLLDDHDFTAATLKGIDASFLAIILLELLHTTLSRGPISQQLQEFLVIGITASIRHGLALAATRGDPRDIVIDLAINAGGALVLLVGLWLVRHQLRADQREMRHREAAHADDSSATGENSGQTSSIPPRSASEAHSSG